MLCSAQVISLLDLNRLLKIVDVDNFVEKKVNLHFVHNATSQCHMCVTSCSCLDNLLASQSA